MYPLDTKRPWARNQWYVAGFAAEFGEQPFERTILGERILLMRSGAGEPIALAGLCPHRFMPLVCGRRTGDTIECAYHGMTFDTAGDCLIGPAAARAAGSIRLRRYPLIERGPLVWIWTGAAEDRNPDLMPDNDACGLDTPGWRADANGLMHFKARYMLMVDNLFDLTHIGWVHASLLGKPTICAQPPTLTGSAGSGSFDRTEIGDVDPFTRMLFPESVGPIENRLGTRLLGPGLITAIGPSVVEAEASPLAGKVWGSIHFVHALTPETEHTTNVFSVVTRDFRLEDDQLSAMLCGQNKAVLAQDHTIAEAVEQALATAATDIERSFRSDRGAIDARRYYKMLIDRETDTDATIGAAAVQPAEFDLSD